MCISRTEDCNKPTTNFYSSLPRICSNSRVPQIIALDISRGFDNVWHSVLMNKPSSYELLAQLCSWIMDASTNGYLWLSMITKLIFNWCHVLSHCCTVQISSRAALFVSIKFEVLFKTKKYKFVIYKNI